MGPAGSGKSTYCHNMVLHARDAHRTINVINLDPAAETFKYEPLVDIKELIQLDDAMEDEELHFGPNGGLIFCMEHLIANADWLKEQIEEIVDEDYILFDCPGQIELYTHMTVMTKFIELLHSWEFRVCGVFLLDSHFMLQTNKFFSGTLTALSVMINLEIPQVNVLSKMDLLSKNSKDQLEKFLEADTHMLLHDETLGKADTKWHQKYFKLSKGICSIIDDYSFVKYMPLDLSDEESVQDLLIFIDSNLQYGEDSDVRARDYTDAEPADEGYND
uniref:GPN-loop GTPase 3 n=1 Tax=Strigamia maritima TaxID=126957 RepID=T1JLM2_STRMM